MEKSMAAEAFRAYLNDDFVFEVGKDKTRVEVPRLLFKDSPAVLNVIARVMIEDRQSAFKFMEKARAFASYDAKNSNALAKAIADMVPALLLRKNHTVVHDLLGILTYGKFTQKIIDTMQVNEAADILAYLVDKNYASLKNSWASLEAMRTSQSPSPE